MIDPTQGTVFEEPREPSPDGVQPPGGPLAPPPWRERFNDMRWQIAGGIFAILLLVLVIFELRPQPPPPPQGANARSIALSSNGGLLAVATLDNTLRLVSPASGHTLARALLPQPSVAVSFGPDNAVLVLSSDHLYIYSPDLSSRADRLVHPHARDLVWSPALDAAIVVSGGADELHPALEFFPTKPLGLASSTSQLFDLTAWSPPACVTASADGSRVAITLNTSRRANVLFYDPAKRKVTAASLVPGPAAGIALAQDGSRAWVVSPAAEAITEIAAKSVTRTDFPKSASTSPLNMMAVNEAGHRAYTTGAVTFPEVDLDQQKISRTFELPTNSAGIVLSSDGSTAYLTYKDLNKIGILDLRDFTTYREIQLR